MVGRSVDVVARREETKKGDLPSSECFLLRLIELLSSVQVHT